MLCKVQHRVLHLQIIVVLSPLYSFSFYLFLFFFFFSLLSLSFVSSLQILRGFCPGAQSPHWCPALREAVRQLPAEQARGRARVLLPAGPGAALLPALLLSEQLIRDSMTRQPTSMISTTFVLFPQT